MDAPDTVLFCPMCSINYNAENHDGCPECGREGE
jgi:hypothetical protein